MLDNPIVNTFTHVKPGDTPWIGPHQVDRIKTELSLIVMAQDPP